MRRLVFLTSHNFDSLPRPSSHAVGTLLEFALGKFEPEPDVSFGTNHGNAHMKVANGGRIL